MSGLNNRSQFFVRVLLVISLCTVLLTASFVGILSILSGEFSGLAGRFPWYIVLAAIIFVATIIILEEGGSDGGTIMVSALLFSSLGFVIIALAVEGVYYAYDYPERVFVSKLVLYFFAAGLIGTGVGYWAVNHWREFSNSRGAI